MTKKGNYVNDGIEHIRQKGSRVVAEGTHMIPAAGLMSGSQTDLNRNFPWSWAPEHLQHGAGSHPLSEPESRAVVEFVCTRPNIFAWLNLHTHGGVFIRPLGDQPDNKMDGEDLAIVGRIGRSPDCGHWQ